MSLIYGDSFQDDEDLCRVLAALQLGSRVTSVTIPQATACDPGTVVDQTAGSTYAVPASRPSLALHDQPTASIASPSMHTRQDSIPNSVYNVSSGKRTGIRETWADAGDACQGVDGGKVAKIRVSPPKQYRRHCVAYVVFEGLAPGIYNSWAEVEPLVKGIPGNVYQGFSQRREAERAYVLAFAMGALRILPARHDTRQQAPAPASPMPEAVLAAFASASDDFLGAEWHVVFKGKRPGVYPAWNFAATQTKGVSCAIFQKFSSKAEAEAAYMQAALAGFVVAVL